VAEKQSFFVIISKIFINALKNLFPTPHVRHLKIITTASLKVLLFAPPCRITTAFDEKQN